MSLLNSWFSRFDESWRLIVRPPRDKYSYYDLGPVNFLINERIYHRRDFSILNSRGLILKCSIFEAAEHDRPAYATPCVVYLHGNCSSRTEAVRVMPAIVSRGMSLVAFDFSGCGKSEGTNISLGLHEKDDVGCVIEHLRKSERVSSIGILGRSMGAVTGLMYAATDPEIKAIVFDSPFYDLAIVIEELTGNYLRLPSFLSSSFLGFIKKSMKRNAGLDIDLIRPLESAKQCTVPALFATGNEDTLVRPHHTLKLLDHYKGDKSLEIFRGTHNSPRPFEIIIRIAEFLEEKLETGDDDLQPEVTSKSTPGRSTDEKTKLW